MNKPLTGVTRRKLRSSEWFNNPHNPGMTALYLERWMNNGMTPEDTLGAAADHRHRAERQRSHSLQPRARGAGAARQGRRPRRRRRAAGISHASHVRELPPADRRDRPQSRLSRAGGDPARLSHRRGGADHGLRQDHAFGDLAASPATSRPSSFRRADAGRLVRRRIGRLRHGDLAEPRRSAAGEITEEEFVDRRGLGAVARPLQHDGHRLDDERRGRGARHCRCPDARPRSPRPTASAARWPTRPASASSKWPTRTCGPRKS